MYGAVYSGLAAARAAEGYLDGGAPDLGSYQREIDGQLAPNLIRARALVEILNAWPRLLNWAAMHSQGVWDAMQRLASDAMSDPDHKRPRSMAAALGPLAAFARRVSAQRTEVR